MRAFHFIFRNRFFFKIKGLLGLLPINRKMVLSLTMESTFARIGEEKLVISSAAIRLDFSWALRAHWCS
jgi:hypothetical protein